MDITYGGGIPSELTSRLELMKRDIDIQLQREIEWLGESLKRDLDGQFAWGNAEFEAIKRKQEPGYEKCEERERERIVVELEAENKRYQTYLDGIKETQARARRQGKEELARRLSDRYNYDCDAIPKNFCLLKIKQLAHRPKLIKPEANQALCHRLAVVRYFSGFRHNNAGV
jgi:hypothetical protein